MQYHTSVPVMMDAIRQRISRFEGATARFQSDGSISVSVSEPDGGGVVFCQHAPNASEYNDAGDEFPFFAFLEDGNVSYDDHFLDSLAGELEDILRGEAVPA